eukprot:546283-Rhodomonas_salina.1
MARTTCGSGVIRLPECSQFEGEGELRPQQRRVLPARTRSNSPPRRPSREQAGGGLPEGGLATTVAFKHSRIVIAEQRST